MSQGCGNSHRLLVRLAEGSPLGMWKDLDDYNHEVLVEQRYIIMYNVCLQNSALNPVRETDPSDVKSIITELIVPRSVGGKDDPLYLPITLPLLIAIFTKSYFSSVLKCVNRIHNGKL